MYRSLLDTGVKNRFLVGADGTLRMRELPDTDHWQLFFFGAAVMYDAWPIGALANFNLDRKEMERSAQFYRITVGGLVDVLYAAAYLYCGKPETF